MAKFLYFTDLHAHPYKLFDELTINGISSRLENAVAVIPYVFKLADQEKCDAILFGGDLFHLPKMLPTGVVNTVVQTFSTVFKRYDIPFYAISGNHDMSMKSTWENRGFVEKSALFFLSKVFPSFVLLDNDFRTFDKADRPVEDQVTVVGVPYFDESEHFRFALAHMTTFAKTGWNIALIHQTPRGIMNEGIPWDVDGSWPEMKHFDLILCGHIHQKQVLSEHSIIVGGSPIQQMPEDAGQDKGVWIIDTEGDEVAKFISLNKDFPVFVENELDARQSDYLVQKIDPIALDVDEAVDYERFHAEQAPTDIVRNYWEVADGKDGKLLEAGLKAVNRIIKE
jgi:DNA repair exonuclease SbcCD nuclease subunit